MPQMLRTVRVPEDVAPGTEIVVFQADEIVEEGIFEVEISLSTVFNKVYQPAGQRAKWFRDELGQLWVKFDSAPPSLSQEVIQHVIPASRVVDVRYKKRESPC